MMVTNSGAAMEKRRGDFKGFAPPLAISAEPIRLSGALILGLSSKARCAADVRLVVLNKKRGGS